MIRSSSIHHLNADAGLGRAGKALWMLLNQINIRVLPNWAGNLRIESFVPEPLDDDWARMYFKASPSRCLSDLFWLKLDWKAIRHELRALHVFDTGAGRGEYALRLNDFSGGLDSYVGTDLKTRHEWADLTRDHPFVSMMPANSVEVGKLIPEQTTMVISQSAIEHFEYDLLYFDQIRQFLQRTRRNLLQIHLFPSADAIRTYRWHGIRQYTPRTVARILALFDAPRTSAVLFRLGGPACTQLHREFITIPHQTRGEDWRDSRLEEYWQRLKLAIARDASAGNDPPAFYALVIHSNYQRPLFGTSD